MAEYGHRKQYGKWLAVFFLAAVSCTVISRAADSAAIPKVKVQKAESGRITYRLKGNGTVEAFRKTTFLVPEGYLVETCLEDGSWVEEGDTLIQFQMEHLKKRKEELEQAWREAALALEQAKVNRQEDAWIPSVDEAGRTLEEAHGERGLAQEEYGRTQEAVAGAQENLNQAQGALERAQEKYERAQEEYGQAQESLSQAQAGRGQDVGTQDPESVQGEGQEDPSQSEYDLAREKAALAQEALEHAQKEYEGAQEEYGQAQESLSQAQAGREQAGQRLESAGAALAQAENAYEAAEKSDDVVRQNNAKARKSADLSVEGAQLAEEAAKAKLQGAEKLLAMEGKLPAETAGIFCNTAVTTGTVTSGSEFISIGTGELLFKAEVPAQERERLALGDKLLVKLPGKEKCQAAITGLAGQKREDGQEVLLLTAALSEDGELAVGQASFSLEKKSEEKYDTVLPLTAIRQDNKGYYCLGIRTRSAILGEEQVGEEIRLNLLDQDDTRAAVEGAVSPDTQIIISSDKPVEDQDRVQVER